MVTYFGDFIYSIIVPLLGIIGMSVVTNGIFKSLGKKRVVELIFKPTRFSFYFWGTWVVWLVALIVDLYKFFT